MVEVLAEEYRFASLLAKSASYNVRELGWSALASVDVAKVGPKGYIHGWIYVGAHPKVGKLVRQTKRDHNGKVITARTGRVSSVADGHVHVAWDDGGSNRVEHVHQPGRGGLMARAEHPEAAKAPNPHGRARPAKKPATAKPATLAERVASGVKSRRRLSGGNQGETSHVEFNDGSHAIHKVIPTNGEQDGKAQQDAEELSALVADRLGVRAAAVHRVGDEESYQDHMAGKTAAEAFRDDHTAVSAGGQIKNKKLAEIVHSDEGLKLGLFDILTANSDRHGGNWLVGPDGKPTAIDHGMTFNPGGAEDAAFGGRGPFRQRFLDRHMFGLGDNNLSPADIAHARTQLEGLRGEFARLGRTEWYEQMLSRLDEVGKHAKGNRRILT